jgi:hypothetical protein
LQRSRVPRIALFVSRKLRKPIGFVGTWRTPITARRVIVSMPETAVHEDNFAARPEDEVWVTGQVLPMQPVTVAKSMHKPPHRKFGLHPFALDAPHVFRTARGRDFIRQFRISL